MTIAIKIAVLATLLVWMVALRRVARRREAEAEAAMAQSKAALAEYWRRQGRSESASGPRRATAVTPAQTAPERARKDDDWLTDISHPLNPMNPLHAASWHSSSADDHCSGSGSTFDSGSSYSGDSGSSCGGSD